MKHGLGAKAGRIFTAEVVGEEHAGKRAEVSVVVRNVAVRELPDDDELAQLAGGFDTLDELRSHVREQWNADGHLRQ